jgi:hypothetical protein
MTVKELKQELEKHPDTMDVFLAPRLTEFTFGLLNSVSVQKINFKDEPDGEIIATEKCLILNED